ncbi:hypothetical protein KIS4809_2930 [Bacillus sp. ZZV12-4809]|nr:hypothetical protein KIS4809_2930 [Bacillus sp. ZZV12-4809]
MIIIYTIRNIPVKEYLINRKNGLYYAIKTFFISKKLLYHTLINLLDIF